MDESILDNIKELLGGEAENYDPFDNDLRVHINTALATLWQLGIGAKNFYLTDDSQTWSDFLGSDVNLPMVKDFVYFNVKLAFDPPNNSFLLESYKSTLAELTWRLHVQVETDSLN